MMIEHELTHGRVGETPSQRREDRWPGSSGPSARPSVIAIVSMIDELEPGVAAAFAHLLDGVWDGRVDPGLLERCRVRVCELIGAPADAGRHASKPEVAGDTDTILACLAFTEMWVVDPHAVSDDLAAGVRSHLSDAEAAAFTIALATIEAQARSAVAWESLT